PAVSGPKRPQDRILLKNLNETTKAVLAESFNRAYVNDAERASTMTLPGQKPTDNGKLRTTLVKDSEAGVDYQLSDGSVVIAAITSCTNTSNPNVMLGAGLVAKKAIEKGLDTKAWVKTSLAPG